MLKRDCSDKEINSVEHGALPGVLYWGLKKYSFQRDLKPPGNAAVGGITGVGLLLPEKKISHASMDSKGHQEMGGNRRRNSLEFLHRYRVELYTTHGAKI